MKKWIGKIRNLFRKKFEVVYSFELETILIDEKKKQDQELLRIDMVNYLNIDLLKDSKIIEYVDMWQDMKTYTTCYTFASVHPKKQPKVMPLFYELYAFKKLKKTAIFTYKFEERIFKVQNNDIKVLKFRIEC